eukprot:EG_transcript_12275
MSPAPAALPAALCGAAAGLLVLIAAAAAFSPASPPPPAALYRAAVPVRVGFAVRPIQAVSHARQGRLGAPGSAQLEFGAASESPASHVAGYVGRTLFAMGAALAAASALVLWLFREEEQPWVMAAAGKGFGPPKVVKPKPVKKPEEEEPCPCCSGTAYGLCCQSYHQGKAVPATPEALLRSRYAAFAKKKRDFIRTTTDPEHLTRNNVTETEHMESVTLSCNNVEYSQLVILKQEPGETEDDWWITFRYWFGFTAEFKGRHKGVTRQSVEKGETETRTERSLFRRTDGVWRFVDSPDEFCNSDSFEVGDTSATQNLLLKAKDAAANVKQLAAQAVLPKMEVRLEEQ